ncbi:MAG: hypothetical protein HY860_06030 [Chlamydiales bacterium]|nr:hypothetical protein [Chlamydiales bacterium]
MNQSPDASGGPSSQTIQQVTSDLQQMYNFMSMGNANNWADPNVGISANFWAYFSDILSISNPGFTKAQQQALETVESYFGNMPNPPTSSDYGQILSDIKSALGSFGGSIPSSNPLLGIISAIEPYITQIIGDIAQIQQDVNQQNWQAVMNDTEATYGAIDFVAGYLIAESPSYTVSGTSIPFFSGITTLLLLPPNGLLQTLQAINMDATWIVNYGNIPPYEQNIQWAMSTTVATAGASLQAILEYTSS